MVSTTGKIISKENGKPIKPKDSVKLKSWKDCKHTPNSTRKLRGIEEGVMMEYEICDICGLSRRIK